MADFEEKLSEILGNQEAMGQIMELARSLSGGSGKGEQEPPRDSGEQRQSRPEPAEARPSPSSPDLSALLGQVDPGMLQMGMRLFQEYQGRDDRSAALLAALRPFLKEERRASLDRALELVRMTRLIRAAFGAAGGREGDGDV